MSHLKQSRGGLKDGYVRYDLLYNRFQGIPSPSSQPLALLRLCALGRPSTSALPLTDPQHAAALAAFDQEVHRVALLYQSKHQRLWSALLEVVGRLRAHADAALSTPEQHTSAHYVELWSTLNALGEGAVELDAFARENIAAVAELAVFADTKELQLHVHDAYTEAAETAVLGAHKIDALILGLSDAFDWLRLLESDAEQNGCRLENEPSSSSSRWIAPKKFTRTTRKFWLRPADVCRFKVEVLKHLPVLVYGRLQKLTEVDPKELPFLAAPTESDSGDITSIYLDSLPDLESYHTRLAREDGATAVRLRWYGSRTADDPCQKIFVEKKVHRDFATTAEKSVKERAVLSQQQVAAFLAGQPVVELPEGNYVQDVQFLADVQQYITYYGQVG